MHKPSLIAGLSMLLAVSGLQAETGGMETKNATAKDQAMGQTQASVTISEPADSAVLTAQQPVKVIYKATPGPKGDHVHLYVDKMRAAVLPLAGEYVIKLLSPGMHKISIEIVTKEHQHIGVGKEITVDARY